MCVGSIQTLTLKLLTCKTNSQAKVVQYFQHEAQVKEQDVKKLEKLVTQLNASVGQAKNNYERVEDFLRDSNDLLTKAEKGREIWKFKAQDLEVESSGWKRKFAQVMDEVNVHVPSFIQHLDKAKEEIHTDPLRYPSSEIGKLINLCENLATGLKRKRVKLLTYQ